AAVMLRWWGLLSLIIAAVHAGLEGGLLVAIMTVGFIGVMLLVVRPIVVRIGARAGARSADRRPTHEAIALALVGLLLSAWTTEQIGVHAIFGAFLFGAMIPHDSGLARALIQKLQDLV